MSDIRNNHNIEVSLTIDNNSIEYHIQSNDFTSSDIFDKSFFKMNGLEYTRIYPPSLMFPHNICEIEKRYSEYINREYFEEKDITSVDSALEWICDIHKRCNIKWWLTGSTALYIRGLDMHPHDIDVMTYLTEIEKLKAIVSDFIVEPFHYVNGWVTKGFGVIDKGIRIDYGFEPEDNVDANGICDFGPYAEKHLEEIKWHDRNILIPPIELHLLSNRRRNRATIVNEIENYIRKRSPTTASTG